MTNFDDVRQFIRSVGNEDTGFAVDFNNTILGAPYIEGTGYFPTKETAEAFAAIMIPILNQRAAMELAANPTLGQGWTDPEEEADDSYAVIVSSERNEHDEPVVEETYFGNVWLVVSAEMGMLTPDQRAVLEALNVAIMGDANES